MIAARAMANGKEENSRNLQVINQTDLIAFSSFGDKSSVSLGIDSSPSPTQSN